MPAPKPMPAVATDVATSAVSSTAGLVPAVASVASIVVALTAVSALGAGPTRVAAQEPPPTSSPAATAAPAWRIHLPIVFRPIGALHVVPEVLRMGGSAMGIAVADGIVVQAHGGTLATWLPADGEEGWTYHGGLDLMDEPAIADAWVTAEGGAATFLRQLEPMAQGAEGSRPVLRLSLLVGGPDGAATAGANLDLSGRLAGQARVGRRLYLSVVDRDGGSPELVGVDVGDWQAPAVLGRQALPQAARHLLGLPEIGLLAAIGQGAGGPELWTWDVGGAAPRALPAAALTLAGSPAALIRAGDGILAVDRSGGGLVVPVRGGAPRPGEARAVAFDLGAAAGPDGRFFGAVDAAAAVAGQVCLYHGVLVSTHSATRTYNNLLACFDLPAGGPPALRRVLAADRLIDASAQGGAGVTAVHLAAAADRLLLSRGSAGGMEVFSPLDAGDGAVRTLDAGPGRVKAVLRTDDRLITAEAGAQLRAWAFDAAAHGGLRPLGRLGLPAGGMLITRDAAPAAAPANVALWRETGLAISGFLQRVRLADDPPFRTLPGEIVRDTRTGLRAAGDLAWVPGGDGRLWRFADAGALPLVLPGVSGAVQDVALVGRLHLLAAAADGLVVLDADANVLGRLPLPGHAAAIAVDAAAAGTAWVATDGPAGGDSGSTDPSPDPWRTAALHAVDVTDPAAPRLVASIDLPGDRVDRLRAAAGRVVGSGWRRRLAGTADPLLFSVDARDRTAPRVEGVTPWDRPPDFLAPPYAEPRLEWDLAPDGRRLYAARGGLGVFAIVAAP